MNKAAARPATAADVAARAGVSRATVSHIFTGRGDNFAETTRDRVLRAAKELDYRPSAAGRSLVLGRGDTIVVIAPKTTIGQNHLAALDRLTTDTAPIGANVVLRFADDDPTETTTALLRMRPLAVLDMGVALPADARERLTSQGVVLLAPQDTAVESGDVDDGRIADIQVGELTRNGPRQIVYAALDYDRPDSWTPSRLTSLRRACEARDLPEPRSILLPPNAATADAMLARHASAGPLGIAAFNDDAALAVLSSARRLRLHTPTDISAVGVDATPLGQLSEPRLSTIAVDMSGLIDAAVEGLNTQLGLELCLPTPPQTEPFRLLRGGTS